MGKAAEKRIKIQNEIMKELAENNPREFLRRWEVNLNTWYGQARALFLSAKNEEEDYNYDSLNSLTEHAWNKLKMAGRQAFEIAEKDTYRFEQYCCNLIAVEMDTRLNKTNQWYGR